MYKDINISAFKETIKKNKVALLCGNGFSMNFDSGYSDIYRRYYKSHKELLTNTKYKAIGSVSTKRMLTQNYNSVKSYLYSFSKNKFYNIFEDALIFAESIICNKALIKQLEANKVINKLVFGVSQLNLVETICQVARNKGLQCVNIEHWTILIYFYFSVVELDVKDYCLPSNNSFISVLKIGDANTFVFSKKISVYQRVLYNGFTNYYRMFVAQTVFNRGKSIEFELLDGKDKIDLAGVKRFLIKFEVLSTTNYDYILELITNRQVIHLHGEFIKGKEEYVFYQSLGTNYNGTYFSFSDLTVGDYFLFKTFLPITNNLSKLDFNKNIPTIEELYNSILYEDKVNSVVIFGLNIENDQHILRNLMLSFFDNKTSDPRIIYCYFSEDEKLKFQDMFNKVITFRKDVSEYSRKIEVRYLKTKDVLNNYFIK